MSDGIQDLQPDKLSNYLETEKKNGCTLTGFNGGKIQLIFSKKGMFLDVSYVLSNGKPVQCMKDQRFEKLYYQGFFGFTSANSINSKNNDIELKAIEFFNLNANYYQDTKKIEKRDYFRIQILQEQEITDSTEKLATTAKDLLKIKRLRSEQEQ